jgi:hypothetical protein
MAAIISLREPIVIGKIRDGEFNATDVLEVNKYIYRANFDKVVDYELLDGRTGIIPLQNIAGIYPLKDEVN